MEIKNPTNTPEIVTVENPETKIQMMNNRNLFKKSLYVAGGFVVILLAVLTFRYFGQKSAQAKFEAVQYQSLKMQPGDSVAMAKYYEDLKKVADDGNYAANQNAKLLYASYLYSEKEDYEGTLAYLDKVSPKSKLVATGVAALKGDCYVNLKKYDKGIECFEDALDEADENPEVTPYLMNKIANVYFVDGKFDKQLEILEKLREEYPSYNAYAIESEIARAKALAKK